MRRPASVELPPPVAHALRCAGLPAESLAFMVAPLDRSSPIAVQAHQPDRPMQPASTIKLLTTVVALDRLGPQHRGHTELLTAAPIDGGRLRGDLVLRGGADPELGLPQLWELLAPLRWQGVTVIEGDIVLDRSLFRPERLDLGLPPFDEAPEFPYNMIPDALQLGGNLVGLELAADEQAVGARLWPPLPDVELVNELVPVDAACSAWDDGWRTPRAESLSDGRVRLHLSGTFPRHCVQRPALQLFERDRQAERQLRLIWEGQGGVWHGHVRAGPTPPEARVLARHEARPWGELIRPLNKRSDNALARLLFLSLGLPGAAAEPQAPTLALADRAVREWFAEHGIDATGLVLDNGSGLSRSERLSARQMVELLRVSLTGPQAAELATSLPIAGIDGAMRNRLKDGPAAGRARLKTGSLRNVAALAGFVPDPDGRIWLLSAMINDDAARRGRPALDGLVDWVARGGPGSVAGEAPQDACPASP